MTETSSNGSGGARQRKNRSKNNNKASMSPKRDKVNLEKVKETLEKRHLSSAHHHHKEGRSGGDGESLPGTPPNEECVSPNRDEDEDLLKSEPSTTTTSTPTKSSNASADKAQSSSSSPFVVQINVDFMACLLLFLGVVTRMTFLDQPRNVVFDEMHYGKYASLYLKKTFFFDANPPLGKMLIAFAGYMAGFNGDFSFEKIGVAYPNEVPVWSLRFIPAFCGSLLTPVTYLIFCEMGLSQWTGTLAALMVLLDTAILTQSRFILLESMMLLFSLLALLSVLKFRKYQSKPFSLGWCFWIVMAGLNMGCAFSVKYLALYSCWLCSFLLLRAFWHRLADRRLSNVQLLLEFAAMAASITLVPMAVYVGSFYVHLGILTKAGAHDSLMTSAFQASLEGGLSSIVQGQPLEVAHGSQITLRHTHGKTCWLHSHEHVYPVRFDDGRGSSHQQQVSCYNYKDVNNWWIVKRPDREDLAVHEPLDVVRNGDVIQLVHGMTHRALNSHDVAAPMSPHNQEVSCYIDYNISMSAENLWRVDLVNRAKDDDAWHSIGSQIRLVHNTTGQALKFSHKLYPEWGFHQHEVVADRQHDQPDTVFNVEEHRYTKNDEDKKSLERELFHAELIPQQATYLSFGDKFLELQIKMLLTNQDNVQNHNYASDPAEWPFLTRGIAYFIAKESNAQVHLLGNILIWYTGSFSLLAYCALLVFYLLRRRRLCYDLPEATFQQFCSVGEVLLAGYLFHFVPFFFYDRTLFLHHYLPAYLFKLMLAAFVFHHLHSVLCLLASGSGLQSPGPGQKSPLSARAYVLGVLLWLAAALVVFWRLCSLCYANRPLSADEVRALRWKDTWDFIVHKP